jgi:hypothetical protein
MSAERRDDVRELRRLFFRRFFDNDVLAPNGEGDDKIGIVYAALAVPGLLVTAPLMVKYMSPHISAGRRMTMALDDKLLFLTVSMLVMAIVALAIWDALALDARDVAVLGSLPLTRATVVRSKLEAIALYAAAVAAALNTIPSVLFPLVLLGPLDIGVLRLAGLVAAHTLVTAAAGAFGFFGVFACRQLLAIAVPHRFARTVSLWAQGTLLVVAVTALLLSPGGPRASTRLDDARGGALSATPPVWFLGVYETVTGRLVMDSPAVLDEPNRAVLNYGQAQRRIYLGYLPQFGRLASTALVTLAALVALALCGYFIESGRAGRLRVTFPGYLPRWARAGVAGIVQRLVVRDPLARATFFFTFQALVRSGPQRLYFLAGMAVATAITVVGFPISDVVGLLRRRGGVTDGVLAVEFFLVFAVVQTMRLVVALPADLRANWIFRLTWQCEFAPYASGVRRAAQAIGAVPLLVTLPAHYLASGATAALVHAFFGALAVIGIVGLCFRDLRILPFTCSLGSGRFNAVLVNAAIWTFAAFVLVPLEQTTIQARGRAPVGMAIALVAIGAPLLIGRRRTRKRNDVVFDAPEDVPTLRLGLSEFD